MLALAYLGFLFMMIFIEIIRPKKNAIDFLTLFNISFVLWYALPGFLVAFDPEHAISGEWLDLLTEKGKIETTLAIFIGYFLVLIGFYSSSAEKLAQGVAIESRNNSIIFIYAIGLLLFAWVSIYIYSAQFGGVSNAITQGLAVRGGLVETNEVAFFIRFVSAAGFSSYLLAAFAFTKKLKKGKLFTILLFIISVILSWISFMLKAGRYNVIYYLLGFYQIYVIKKKKFPWFFTCIFIGFAAVFLVYGKNLFSSLSAIQDGSDAVVEQFNTSVGGNEQQTVSLYSFMDNFNYTFFSLAVSLSRDYDMRFFVDLIYGLVSIIPKRLTGIEVPETILYYNSVYMTGGFDVAIPTGFLAFGIYSMSWTGLILVCLTYGWSGGYLQAVLEKYNHQIFWMPYFYALMAQTWAGIQGSDPETFFLAYFTFLMSTFFLFWLGTKLTHQESQPKIK